MLSCAAHLGRDVPSILGVLRATSNLSQEVAECLPRLLTAVQALLQSGLQGVPLNRKVRAGSLDLALLPNPRPLQTMH